MKIKIIIAAVFFLIASGNVFAKPDFYQGDVSVFAGSNVNVPSNIVFLFDISRNMTTPGSAISYNPKFNYIAAYENASEGNTSDYTYNYVSVLQTAGKAKEEKLVLDIDLAGGQSKYVSCERARIALINNGIWIGSLDNNGNCDDKKPKTYYSSNMASLIYEYTSLNVEWQENTEYKIGSVVSYNTGNKVQGKDEFIKFVVVNTTEGNSGSSGSTMPGFSLNLEEYEDNELVWRKATSALDLAAEVLRNIALDLKDSGSPVRFGLATLAQQNQGADLIQELVSIDSAGLTLFNAGLDILKTRSVPGNHWQVNEALWDVGTYFSQQTDKAISSGGNPDFSMKDTTYNNASEHWCQQNHIVLVTSGLEDDTTQTSHHSRISTNLIPSYDITYRNEEGELITETVSDKQGSSVDVARHLYAHLNPTYLTLNGPYRVRTHALGLFSGYIEELHQTTKYGGSGIYEVLDSPGDLVDVLPRLILSLLEADSSFVAPVVPANPENQAYSGDRIFLGFFKPMNDEPWCGNIKKFALDRQNRMLGFDSQGNLVSAVNQDGDFFTDINDNPTVGSFWDNSLDGGMVDAGGVGEKLLVNNNRKIYTVGVYDNAESDNSEFGIFELSSNKFDNESLNLDDSEDPQSLIDFIYGNDAYGEYPDGGGKRRWIKGDVMHSKPVILSYQNYAFPDDEDNPLENKSYIFVGSNDGMLHAYKDVDGTEAWAFIPEELLPNLQYLRDYERHYYFVDGSPVIYVHDAKDNGNITAEDGDIAILIFGTRRGGGSSILGDGHGGSTYYALDITDPENPDLLWRINSKHSDFAEMGQTWSLPTPAKMKIDGKTKIVAVIGGGYHTEEDLRYGATQKFPDDTIGSTVTSLAPSGEGVVTSLGTKNQFKPAGRGIYFVEIAELSEDGASTNNTGSLIKSLTLKNGMNFSFPSDPLVIDTNFDTYADTVYIGDTGGQLWRLDVHSSNTSDWSESATLIFVANEDNATDVGRKIFYKPTATVAGHDTFVFFGTGDREHPLNTAVEDRFYMIRDRRVPFYITDTTERANYKSTHSFFDYSSPLTEVDLVDVTENDLQDGDLTEEEAKTLRAKLTPPNFTDGTDIFYGWYIKLHELNQNGEVQLAGEKVLASPRVFDGKVYFTTYQPTAHTQEDDPCVGILGPARLYIVDAFTGEAVFNLYKVNDEADGTPVLERRDRYYDVGRGIASEPIVRVDRQGQVSVMVGRGGGFFNSVENPDVDLGTFDPLYPIYWMKW